MSATRRQVLSALVLVLASSPGAQAQDALERSLARQLEAQGFSVTEIRRTLLGRVRVVATRGGQTREIVVDPRNGAILRDFTSGGVRPVLSDDREGRGDDAEDPDEPDDRDDRDDPDDSDDDDD